MLPMQVWNLEKFGLENLEKSGNFLNLEKSGKSQGISFGVREKLKVELSSRVSRSAIIVIHASKTGRFIQRFCC